MAWWVRTRVLTCTSNALQTFPYYHSVPSPSAFRHISDMLYYSDFMQFNVRSEFRSKNASLLLEHALTKWLLVTMAVFFPWSERSLTCLLLFRQSVTTWMRSHYILL
jgi:hypothetical protein